MIKVLSLVASSSGVGGKGRLGAPATELNKRHYMNRVIRNGKLFQIYYFL